MVIINIKLRITLILIGGYMKKYLIIMVSLLLVVLTGCSTNDKSNDKFTVVASTTMLGDLVQQIGKDKVDVTLLFGPGIDPHLTLPTGGDTAVIKNADLVVFSGLHLEAQFRQVLDSYKDKTIEVGEMIDESFLLYVEEDGGKSVDPHIWFNVILWKEVTKVVRDELMVKDSINAEFYQKNAEEYLTQLDELNEYIISRTNELTKEQRVLVTAHDAFNYFANTYGYEVAAIAGISTEGEVTTEDINNVASTIINHSVKSIFIESTVPQTTVDAVIAEVKRRGGSVAIGNELYSDALGVNEDAQYINALKKNIDSIVAGLK